MSKRLNVQLAIIFIALIFIAVSQVVRRDPGNHVRVMFYNVENLFHPSDDPMTDDDEFTPDGPRHWDQWKYREKLTRIYKVIAAVGESSPPAVIGLCEIENAVALRDLVQNTPLRRYNYQYIHYDSPDRRGIDVGMIYRPDIFTPVYSGAPRVSRPGENFLTRDLLYVKGYTRQGDTLHIVVAHWPSRYGGFLSSSGRRLIAARATSRLVDSICSVDPASKVLVMGDFNDGPGDSSLRVLTAGPQHLLDNLMDPSEGSIRYEGKWFLFDQFLCSETLLDPMSDLRVKGGKAKVYRRGFLLEKDEKYLGSRPYRTYSGYRYRQGFSDHLPVWLDLESGLPKRVQ